MKGQSLLWQISRKNTSESFVYGTMHVRDDIAFRQMDKALGALEKTSLFFAEMDLDEAARSIKPEDYMMPEGQDIRSHLSARHYERMKQILFKAFGFRLEYMTRVYPILIINQIAESLMAEGQPAAPDYFLWQKAKESGKDMHGLEAVDFQLDVLRSLNIDDQLRMLRSLCRNPGRFRKQISKLVALYVREDIDALHRHSRKDLGAFRHPLMYDRNQYMVEVMGSQGQQSCFYAVGAAHLGGHKGILALLKRQGWSLKPVFD